MEQFDEKQSLHLIEQMIENAKSSVKENGFHYLLWGWLVLTSSLIHFALLNFSTFSYPFLPWPVIMPIGGIIAMIYGSKTSGDSKVTTYFDTVQRYLWSAFVISLLLMLFITISTKNELLISPSIMILIGLAIFTSGGCLKFKPLIVGGLFSWFIGAISIFLPEWQLLLLGLSVLVGYLIPGYMLQRRVKNQKAEAT